MDKIIFQFKLFGFLLGVWMLFSLSLAPVNILIGGLFSLLVVFLSKGTYYHDQGSYFSLPSFGLLLGHSIRLILDMYYAGFCLLVTIIKGNDDPIIFSMDLENNNLFITTLIANSITLTPGTITLDQRRNRLLVLSVKNDFQQGKTIGKDIKTRLEQPFLKGGI
ncbi:Na+/H+ antiporter subunit E [Isachenkonia alkalipeptolytica]|uniref:Na+/H+ antiporter subunit E n=1 Tax=Isachenkonia alkalipeptolytica TaxID=2565777 RepID=A0AA43XL60_9CLOT|nr:Na+/H+ antiporter subunit E [Isachenkonia alkalipeptolytica]NBG87890.1 hypothetical protein [Isachenkonia alkalipeptolytica]